MFKSLHHILDVIENQPGWEVQQQFRLILAQWSGVVGVTVANHTRPTGIDRSVLRVATSSPIWAQELTFKRRLILQKLYEKLGDKIIADPLASNLTGNFGNQPDRLTPIPKNPLPLNSSGHPQPMKSCAIKDIRFSPGQWRSPGNEASPIQANHPSHLPPRIKSPGVASSIPSSITSSTPSSVTSSELSSIPSSVVSSAPSLNRATSINTLTWWQEVQERSHHLPLCSQCHCPTPPGEIDRWSCCALCATKKWSR